MDKLEVLKAAFLALSYGFCFSIAPWVLLGIGLAWLMPSPKGAQGGNVTITINQSNDGGSK